MGDFELIVDKNDNVIGSKHWKEKSYHDTYRVSALWLTDIDSGDILLAQRKWSKINDPGKWAETVAGTLEENETYDINIEKEIQEEIGLTGLDLHLGPKLYVDDGKHKFFCQWYLANIHKDKASIKIQEDEVEAVKWVSKKWLINDVKLSPDTYTPMIPKFLKVYYGQH